MNKRVVFINQSWHFSSNGIYGPFAVLVIRAEQRAIAVLFTEIRSGPLLGLSVCFASRRGSGVGCMEYRPTLLDIYLRIFFILTDLAPPLRISKVVGSGCFPPSPACMHDKKEEVDPVCYGLCYVHYCKVSSGYRMEIVKPLFGFGVSEP